MWLAPEPRKVDDCSLRSLDTSSASSLLDFSGLQLMKLSKTDISAARCSSSLSGEAVNTLSWASMSMQAANSRCRRKFTAISERRRKPHIASNGVSAIAISGLWLASLYCCGFCSCNIAARSLSGWAWMLSALPALKTLNNHGSWPFGASTTFASSVPSSSKLGPEGCVPATMQLETSRHCRATHQAKAQRTVLTGR